MGEKADIETAKAVTEYAQEVTLPELLETLAATKKTVKWLEDKIAEIQSYNPKQSAKRLGEGNG